MGSVGSRLKEAREAAGLTLDQLAGKTGYHVSTLSNAENGNDRPSKRLVRAVAEATGCSTEELEQSKAAKPNASYDEARRPSKTILREEAGGGYQPRAALDYKRILLEVLKLAPEEKLEATLRSLLDDPKFSDTEKVAFTKLLRDELQSRQKNVRARLS